MKRVKIPAGEKVTIQDGKLRVSEFGSAIIHNM